MPDVIDKISEIRKTNNDCWMKLLRLAMERAPEQTRAIMKEITRNDRKVSEWLDKL